MQIAPFPLPKCPTPCYGTFLVFDCCCCCCCCKLQQSADSNVDRQAATGVPLSPLKMPSGGLGGYEFREGGGGINVLPQGASFKAYILSTWTCLAARHGEVGGLESLSPRNKLPFMILNAPEQTAERWVFLQKYLQVCKRWFPNCSSSFVGERNSLTPSLP